ncbi:MAG: CapA family protein [Roseiflexaceae bacterium]
MNRRQNKEQRTKNRGAENRGRAPAGSTENRRQNKEQRTENKGAENRGRAPAGSTENRQRRSWSLVVVLVGLALVLAGCVSPAPIAAPVTPPALPTGQPVDEQQASTRAPSALPTAQAVDEQQWRVLYRRAGWAGGPAVDLRAVGDVMLGRYVAAVAEQRGRDYPFAAARALLAGDLAIGNLESPLTARTELRPGPYRLPADPAFAAPLQAAGFVAMSLANNHGLDAGPSGLQDASAALAMAGMLPLGARADAAAAHAPVVVVRNGLRVALLGFNDVADPQDAPDEGQGWGRAWLDDAALAAVRQARQSADLVVVLPHWGREYDPRPSDRQREWAGRLVAAGADLVVGAHPHVLQPIEMLTVGRRTGLVAYSLGNFIFDQPDRAATSTSAALRVLLDRQGVALAAAAPVEIVAGQARPLALGSAAAQLVLQALRADAAGVTASVSLTPQPGATVPAGVPTPAIQAWSWDGATASAVEMPPAVQLAARPRRLPVDLRGDGRPLWATLDDHGLVEVRDGPAADAPLVWHNEAADWRVTRIDAGDPDGDGRIELVLLLWKPDAAGVLRSHPFLMGWRGGHYRIIWGGSATATPIQDLALGDLNGDGRQDLAILEGGHAPGAPAQTVSVWDWHGWGFELEWRSAPLNMGGVPLGLALQDVTGDGVLEMVVATTGR